MHRKHGSQRERETVFQAIQEGWSMERIGSHIVRHNRIHDCEQTAICGHLGAICSEIYGNHIWNIHVKRQFSGHEMAGIKLHAPIDCLIRDNCIHHSWRGMWMDWQTQGTRLTANILWGNTHDDIYVEVSHGPYVVDHNIMLSALAIKDCAQGGCYAHNLIGGKIHAQPVPDRYTHYHLPHSTAVAGMMTIMGGDQRYLNNLFAPAVVEEGSLGAPPAPDENALPAKRGWARRFQSAGTSCYNHCPEWSDWMEVFRVKDEVQESVKDAASTALPNVTKQRVHRPINAGSNDKQALEVPSCQAEPRLSFDARH